MKKINALVEVSVVELLKIAEKCASIIGDVTSLIKENASDSEKESPLDPNSNASDEPKQETSSEVEILPGVAIKKHPTKPFEMVIE